MTDEHRYDLLILGGGMSYVGAIRAAQLGMKVAIIERDKMGGTCLNRGCIPSKALLETADLLHRAKELGGEFGLTNTDSIGLDPANLGKRRDAVVDKHVKGVEFLMKKNKVDILRGHGVLTSPTSVKVSGGESGDLEASATDLILATGSAPRHLPDLTVDQDRVIDSDEALRRDAPPKSVTIIGAGAIGVEWASLYGDLGAEVRLVEFMDRIVPLEDPDVSKELARLFRKRGMAIHAASTVDPASLQRTKTGIRHAMVANDGGERAEVESDWILVAIGRRPVTENIGLEQIEGVTLDRGFIVVDGNMRTGVSHLYAIGDVVPGYALAHVASHESLVAVETIAGREPEPIRMDLMPRVTFCRPEIASVGLSEEEAIQAGHEVKVGSFPFRALGKATIVGEVDGFAKFVADAGTGQLLGAHIIGPHAGDLLAEPTFARLVEGTAEEIAMSVHAHPTLTEVLAEAALAVDGAALHV